MIKKERSYTTYTYKLYIYNYNIEYNIYNLVNNLSEGIHRIKCKYEHDDKECETCRIKYDICECFLEHSSFKDDLIENKCLCCNKSKK